MLLRLIVDANRVLSVDTLLDDVWSAQPEPASAGTLQSHVSLLRRIVGSQLDFTPPGYVLHLGAEDLDSWCYERDLNRAQAALAGGEAQRAAALLRGALARWRGPALAEVAAEMWAVPEATRLEELRIAGVETLVKCLLLVANDSEAVSLAEWAVSEHPLREHLWAHLMMGLARQGRNAEALRAYQRLRQHLVDGLGLDPSPYLSALEQGVLAQRPIEELWNIWVAGALDLPGPTREAGQAGHGPLAVAAEPAETDISGPPLAPDGVFGRQAELEVLEQAARSVLAEQAATVAVVTSEPGMGRSKLVELVAGRVQPLGYRSAGTYRLGTSGAELAELAERLHAESGDGPPQYLVFEDLHDASDASVHALDAVLAALRDLPVLVALTARHTHVPADGSAERLLQNLARNPATVSVALRGLEADELAALAAHRGGEAAVATDTAALAEATGGNPSLVAVLVEQARPGRPESLPPTLSDLVEEWVSPLSPWGRAVLDVIALARRSVGLWDLSDVLGRPAVDVVAAIDELDRLDLLAYEPDGRVRVRLAVVAQALVESLSPGRRVLLSAQLSARGRGPGFAGGERRVGERRGGDRRGADSESTPTLLDARFRTRRDPGSLLPDRA